MTTNSPLMYDFLRTLKSKTMVVSVMLLIFGVVPFIPGITSHSSQFQGNLNASGVVYHDSGGYRVLVYVTNEFGQPIAGVGGQFALKSLSGQNYPSTGATNSSGYMFVTINAPASPQYLGGFHIDGFNDNQKILWSVPSLGPGQTYALPAAQPFATITDNSNASRRMLSVFYIGPGGGRPPSYSVRFAVQNSSGTANNNSSSQFATTNPLSEEQMRFVGTLSDYHQTFQISIPPSQVCTNQDPPCGAKVSLSLFSQNGSLVFTGQLDEVDLYPPSAPPVQPNYLASQFFVGSLGWFVPLIAIIGSFSAYGRDRVTGVLESVLARPVTKKGLAASRFISTFLALSIALLISIGIIDILLYVFNGVFLDGSLVFGSVLSFLVELSSFMGLMFLISHVVKSSSSLIITGIVLLLALVLLPQFILGAVGSHQGSTGYIQDSIIIYFLDPAQFVSAVNVYLTNQVTAFSVSVQPSSYGVTIASLLGAGFAWSVVPVAAFLRLAARRD